MATVISQELLRLLPQNRKKEKRTLSLTLDELIDDYRKLFELTSSELDFLLMAYRYEYPFQHFLKDFLKEKKIKPEEMLDLWRLAFASLLTRKEENIAQLTHAWVEASKSFFGEFTATLTNAFCRSVLREKEKILAECRDNPDIVLGPELSKRWAKYPELRKLQAKKVLLRPEAGISALTREGLHKNIESKSFEAGTHLAMNEGSNEWIQYILKVIYEKFPEKKKLRILDACAAPGGKLIALLNALPDAEAFAVEAKFKRLERFQENIKKWKLESRVKSQLHDWSEPLDMAPFDIVLADLPCTGLGTLGSRPDLLQKSWTSGGDLYGLQKRILDAVLPHVAPQGIFFVSICSSDPSEVQHLSTHLEQKAIEVSKSQTAEEITGWVIIK